MTRAATWRPSELFFTFRRPAAPVGLIETPQTSNAGLGNSLQKNLSVKSVSCLITNRIHLNSGFSFQMAVDDTTVGSTPNDESKLTGTGEDYPYKISRDSFVVWSARLSPNPPRTIAKPGLACASEW